MRCRSRGVVVVFAVAAAAVVGGCGGSGSSSSGATKPKTTAIAVLRSLKSGGLPIGGYINYTAANDGNHLLGRPGQYVSKVNFRDKRLEAWPDFDSNGGGTIETFASEDDAKKRYDYVHTISSSSSLFAEYEYRDGTVLLRLSHYLTPNQAAEYERAFKAG